MTHNAHDVAIIMATYNGEKYISDQIKSIQNQTFRDWTLYIRDDGSKDDTVKIINALSDADKRIKIIQDENGNIGFNRNFYELLSKTSEEYVFFSDQDDKWLPQKLERILVAIKSSEGPDKGPTLVHCDCSVADAELAIKKKRFIGSRGRSPGLR